jgi:hypothetical protein
MNPTTVYPTGRLTHVVNPGQVHAPPAASSSRADVVCRRRPAGLDIPRRLLLHRAKPSTQPNRPATLSSCRAAATGEAPSHRRGFPSTSPGSRQMGQRRSSPSRDDVGHPAPPVGSPARRQPPRVRAPVGAVCAGVFTGLLGLKARRAAAEMGHARPGQPL